MSVKREREIKRLLWGLILAAIVLLSSCYQWVPIFIPGLGESDPNSSTVSNPYQPINESNLHDLLNMDTDKPLYIDIPVNNTMGISEANTISIPSGKQVFMTVDGNLGINTAVSGSSSNRAVNADDYALIEQDGKYIPSSTSVLITVESGASLTLSGNGRIGGTIYDNPSRTLVYVEEGGSLTINGDLTFIAFPYDVDNPEKDHTAIYSDGTLTINGGNFFSTYRTVFCTGDMNINDGTFVSIASNKLKTGFAYAVTGAGTTHITGGTYYGIQGALAQNRGRGEIDGATTRLAHDIFTNIGKINADIEKELAAFYDLNVTDPSHNHENLADNEFWHGLYIAGETGEVNKITVSGGNYYTEGSSGRGLSVGNNADGGMGAAAAVDVTGGTFYSKMCDTVSCAGEYNDDGVVYGKGTLVVSGGTFGTGKQNGTSGIRAEDLAADYEITGPESDGTNSWYTVQAE